MIVIEKPEVPDVDNAGRGHRAYYRVVVVKDEGSDTENGAVR
jgi:hypothetical protein